MSHEPVAFEQLTAVERIADLEFGFEVPDGWQQGRGAFGGLVLAAMTRSMEAVADDPGRPVRSLTAELMAPVLAGPSHIVVRRLREGTGLSVLSAELRQEDRTLAHAITVWSKSRAGDLASHAPDPPPPLRWQDTPVVPMEAPGVPVFAKNYEFRMLPPYPFQGHPTGEALGFIRPKAPGKARDAAYVVAQADAWFPSFFSMLEAPRPIATVAFSLSFVGSPPEGNDPWLHRGKTFSIHEGHASELRELWSADGRLIAINHQVFVIIR